MELSEDEFLEKYAEVEVTFDSYYKYAFKYVGYTDPGPDGLRIDYKYAFKYVGYTDPGPDGLRIEVSYGGAHWRIYRFELKAGHTVKLGETAMSFYRGTAETISGEIIDEFYEF
jgi:hypothetical protein